MTLRGAGPNGTRPPARSTGWRERGLIYFADPDSTFMAWIPIQHRYNGVASSVGGRGSPTRSVTIGDAVEAACSWLCSSASFKNC
jgi:hypothetical protein